MNDPTAILMVAYKEYELSAYLQSLRSEMPLVPIYVFADGIDPQFKSELDKCSVIPLVFVNCSDIRKGYSKAMREAMRWIYLNTKYSDIVTTDSDACYSAAVLNSMVQNTETNIVGYRTDRLKQEKRYYVSAQRFMMRALFHIKMKDYTNSCRKLCMQQMGETALRMKYSKYGFWMEFDAIWSSLDYRINEEVPVEFVSKPTKIFHLRNMPKILLYETMAIIRTWWSLK